VLVWSEDVNVEIKNFSRHHMTATVQMKANGSTWKFTGFYGHPNVGKRHEAWNLLWYLRDSAPKSWLWVGDFNEINEDAEKFGGALKPRRQMVGL
jgi:hypothetical protein